MPIYEYLCQSCGKKFEVLQKFSDDPVLVHPDCGGKVEKLISAPSFQFKGTGWYVTDYARAKPGAKPEGQTESKSEAKSDSKSDGKSESKADTKSESKSEAKSEAKPEKKDSKSSSKND